SACSPVEIATYDGQSAAEAQANAERLAQAQACADRLAATPLGPPADGRVLLERITAAGTEVLSPYAVVIYPSVAAFAASATQVATGGAFTASPIAGRFAPTSIAGCGLQFYPATAAAIAWCDDTAGSHDPDHDTAVAALAKVLSSPI